jgi:hypothetical protein
MIKKFVYQKSPDFVFRNIAEEMILVPIKSNTADLTSIYSMNEVAGRIYELIDGNRTINEIKKIVWDGFEVDETVLEKDLDELIDVLIELEAIKKI